MKKETFENWNPNFRYTWTLKRMQAWVDQFGDTTWWNGQRWAIKYKRVVPGRYNVWFEKV